MSISQTGQHIAVMAEGGIGWGTPTEDDAAVVGILAATEQASDGAGVAAYDVNPTTHVVTVGRKNIPGEDNHTTKWSPGAGGDGTWDGLQRR